MKVIFLNLEKRNIINMNFLPVKLYDLIKSHKPSNPIHPVVLLYINNRIRELDIKINTPFKQKYFSPKRRIENSIHLVEK